MTDPEPDTATRAAVTIGRPADELRALWLDPATQAGIWSHFARVSAADDGSAEWVAAGPAGGEYRWRTRLSDAGAQGVHWASEDGADLPNTGTLTFRPAPGDRGTEAHLDVRFDPPGGLIGEALAKLFAIAPREIVSSALYKFRALATTGEIPTTFPQPAARHGGLDR
jgi:uncharacterized membrane protein